MSLVTHDARFRRRDSGRRRMCQCLPALLLLFSGLMKLLKVSAVIEGMAHYGYPERLILLHMELLEVGCTIIYLIPRTAILGAILMTAYLGGATATNVRVGDPSFIGPVLAGNSFVWAGLYCAMAVSGLNSRAKVNSAGRFRSDLPVSFAVQHVLHLLEKRRLNRFRPRILKVAQPTPTRRKRCVGLRSIRSRKRQSNACHSWQEEEERWAYGCV